MSGRFSFTAGNTLTAAQLNTNVMDGIFYKMQAGVATVTMTSGSPWSTGSLNVTNLSGFTQNPLAIATCNTSISQAVVATVQVTSTTAMTIRVNAYLSSATSRDINWMAFQATPSTSAGS
jgi:hypothetical protein